MAWVATLLIACGGRARKGAEAGDSRGSASPVELRSEEDHPRLLLVAREGDPYPAVAVGVAHDRGADASIALSSLLAERLSAALGRDVEARPSGTGLVLVSRADTPEAAERFVQATAEALARPVTAAEAARLTDPAKSAAAIQLWQGPAEAAVGACTGELGVLGPRRPPRPADVDALRESVRSTRAVAFSAVGPRPVLEAVATALAETPAWPAGEAPRDPWPTSDVVGLRRTDGDRTLSVALRFGDPARVLEAARSLGARTGALAAEASQFEPSWTLERVVGTVRPRGACLRADLVSRDPAPTPLHQLGKVAALAADELSSAVGRVKGRAFSVDLGVLGATDPRDAAATAAWRALSGQLEPGPDRTFAAIASSVDDAGEGALARAMADARAEARLSTVEVRSRLETGQGELWALLGSPCASVTESNDDAGATALLVRIVSQQARELDGVRVEPWVSAEGLGLLAHAAHATDDESPAELASRVGEALGRTLAGSFVAADTAAAARADLERELSAGVPILWATALSALSPEHPSVLDPRGTFQSLSGASTQALEARRRAFARGPLRLAVLSNATPTQPQAVERAVARWLRPLRDRGGSCPRPLPPGSRPGEYVVDPPAGVVGGRDAIVGVSVPSGVVPGVPMEAALTVHLLNRPGGWLDRSVRTPGLASQAEASLLGGEAAAALVVQIATTDLRAREAAAQLRALLSRLAEGAATSEDLVEAATALNAARAAAELDPRHRTVRAWLGRPEPDLPDLTALRRFHRLVFAPERHVVVLSRKRP